MWANHHGNKKDTGHHPLPTATVGKDVNFCLKKKCDWLWDEAPTSCTMRSISDINAFFHFCHSRSNFPPAFFTTAAADPAWEFCALRSRKKSFSCIDCVLGGKLKVQVP